jgi:hypothetical protein
MTTIPRSVWLSLAAIAAMLGLQGFLPANGTGSPVVAPPAIAAPGGTAPGLPGNADFVGTGAIELTEHSAAGVSANILVRNDTGKNVDVTIATVATDHAGALLSSSKTVTLTEKFSRQTVAVPLPNGAGNGWIDNRLPARGVVTLQVAGSEPKVRDLIIQQRQPSPIDRGVTGVSGLVAFALFVYGLAISTRSTISPAASAPTWTPKSWSSNLAIAGGLLSSLLAITALPAQTHYATRATYTTLSALFTILVVLPPSVYGLLKADQAPSQAAALRIFAFATAITVWATIGQLGTALFLFLELSDAHLVSTTAATTSAVIVSGVALLVAIYAGRAINECTDSAPAAVAGPGPVPPPAAVNQLRLI